ncbi:MAG: hypothetical protein FD153_563 [Rhodospirillaceae bacterium]|nr:MAG: hypothetical protein FD153_563 [Rhodospirillaceae bacterium]
MRYIYCLPDESAVGKIYCLDMKSASLTPKTGVSMMHWLGLRIEVAMRGTAA